MKHPMLGTLYKTAIVVDEFDAAKHELSATLGIEWGPVSDIETNIWVPDRGARTVALRFTFSAPGPTRLELVQSVAESLWAVNPPGQIHHFGYFCDDVTATSEMLRREGAPLCMKLGVRNDHDPAPAVYHQLRSGLFVELVDRALEAQLFPTDAR